MSKLLLLSIFLVLQNNVHAQTNYNGLVNAAQFLNTKWVDEPNQRRHQMRMQQTNAGASRTNKPYINPIIYPKPLTCSIQPIYSVIDGTVLSYSKVCK